MKKLKTVKAAIIALSLLFAVFVPQVAVAQDAKAQVCEGVGLVGGSTGCANPSGSPSVEKTIQAVVNILSILVGVAAIIMIIVGGLKYIMSSGDSGNVNSAKNTILYAVIGLVVVLLAQVIVRFVINRVSTPPPPKCPQGQTLQSDGSCA